MASSGFPEDMVIEILSLLPMKSLLRFRYVCRSWCALIESHSFNNRIATPSRIFIKRRIHDKDEFLFLSKETLEVSENRNLQYFPEYGRVKLDIVGCYNGIICLVNYWNKDVILWNPSTRQSKVVPKSLRHMLISFPRSCEIGFGYDFKSNDFKVVRFDKIEYRGPPFKKQADIYSLNTDSWRISDVKPPAFIHDGSLQSSTCINGIYFCWLYTHRSVDDEVLFSFDMSDETFQGTPLPHAGEDKPYCNNSFMELKESVGLIQSFRSCPSEIWVLNEFEYGSKGTWTKLYTIAPITELYYYRYRLGFWKNSELFMGNHEGELVLYDPITQEVKNLQLDERNLRLDEGIRSVQLSSYKESLVSIKGGNHLA